MALKNEWKKRTWQSFKQFNFSFNAWNYTKAYIFVFLILVLFWFKQRKKKCY